MGALLLCVATAEANTGQVELSIGNVQETLIDASRLHLNYLPNILLNLANKLFVAFASIELTLPRARRL